MKTREQVTVTGDFPAGPWTGSDIAARDRAWKEMLRRCADQASSRGLRLTGDEPLPDRSMLFMKSGSVAYAECPRAEAEFVRLRLSAWAEPAAGS